MKTFYKPESIRIANYQTKLPTDIGRFRARVIEFTPAIYTYADMLTFSDFEPLDDDLKEGFRTSLPSGGFSSWFGTEAEAVDYAENTLIYQGWLTDKDAAQTAAIDHAAARKNAHPNR